MIPIQKFVLRIGALAILLLSAAFSSAAPPLKDGERMVFIGDSITEQQIYTRYVMDYFALRYPGSTIHFRNRGIAGAPATFRQQLYDQMMKSCRPTVASICFGMNDGHYKPFEQSAYDSYVASMTRWVQALKKDNVRVLILTPGCVDQAQSPQRLGTFYNETLRRLADGAKTVAAREGVPVFDLHALMLDVQTRAQQQDRKFCMIPDGVHPGPPGHVLMAVAILKLLQCSDPPAQLEIDLASSKVDAQRCQVMDLKIAPETVTFKRVDDALPISFEPEAASVFKYYTLPEEINAYRFRVRDLAAGKWKLAVAGKAVASFTAEQLMAGVDLSALPGPWVALSRKIDSANAELSARYYQAWRGFSPIHYPKEVEPERAALVDRLLELIEADEATATQIPAARRTWDWKLTLEN
jgi:lysophospholipase L1-like esterase